MSEFSKINFNYIVLLSRVARSPYIAKKYGHLLDGNEFYDEIKTYKVNFKLSLSTTLLEHVSHFAATSGLFPDKK